MFASEDVAAVAVLLLQVVVVGVKEGEELIWELLHATGIMVPLVIVKARALLSLSVAGADCGAEWWRRGRWRWLWIR